MTHCLRSLILIGCCLFISSLAHSQLQKIYLHPKSAGSEKQSKFVDSIRFIPLEIKAGIELTNYNNVEVTANYFMIRDYANLIILLYAKDGRFIKKINYKKLGMYFYPSYDEHNEQLVFFGNNKNYVLTPRDKIKVKLDWSNPHNKKYYKKYTVDLNDTSFAIKRAIPQQSDILYANYLYDDLYDVRGISTSDLYKDSLDYEYKIYKGNQLVKGFFPYNRINETKYLFKEENVSVISTDTPYVHFLTRPYCDTIYKMVKDSLLPYCQVVLPLENSLPASFFTMPFKNKTERENFERNNGWMLRQIHSVFETPQFIYLLIGYLSNWDTYVYQKQTNTTFKVKNIKPDSSQYNLKLLSEWGVTRKKNNFYSTQKAGDIISFFEKNKNVPVPKELESFIRSNPPATTPVIVEFKLKS
ncbi:hypothetical protein Niako_1709 [Niastella koreensis GR20-10]|uniref:Uncharacterized protein n=1 Tax=Niastella koreensis (strain DSM 17620 / KACC 11465 / NBRC 106392 / GR20-10) TaxID=700598 RepID=G8T9A5_NIAKG|nr:hypothetical protein Niako_1709 [Niastella koreensis GR20-10]